MNTALPSLVPIPPAAAEITQICCEYCPVACGYTVLIVPRRRQAAPAPAMAAAVTPHGPMLRARRANRAATVGAPPNATGTMSSTPSVIAARSDTRCGHADRCEPSAASSPMLIRTSTPAIGTGSSSGGLPANAS